MLPEALNDNAQFTHHTARVNGVNLHYVIGGQGDPLLLWHGFLGTWFSWRKLMPLLAERYTVIAPDMRGYGDSDKPEKGYDARTLAEDFRALVQHLGYRDIAIVAHDMGAPPALVYAGEYPDEVRALAYLEEPVLLSAIIQQILTFAPETMQNGGLWWWSFALAPNIAKTLIEGHEQAFLTWFYDQNTAQRSAVDDATVKEYLRSFEGKNGIAGAFGVYRAIFESIEQTERYAHTKITVPMLGLGGDKVLGEKVMQGLKQVATSVQGEAIPHCGHFIAEEQPEALADRLTAFLASVGR